MSKLFVILQMFTHLIRGIDFTLFFGEIVGGWGSESNREIKEFLCCESVRERVLFQSLGLAAPTCPTAPSPLFPIVLKVKLFAF